MASGCRATNQAGRPCSALPWRDGWCRWHHPDLAAERREWSRRGGENKSHKARARKQLPAGVLTNAELQGVVGITIRRVLTGATEPAVANSVAALARAYVTIRQAGELEERLTALEAAAGIGEGRTA